MIYNFLIAFIWFILCACASTPSSSIHYSELTDNDNQPTYSTHLEKDEEDDQVTSLIGQERFVFHIGPMDLTANQSVRVMLDNPVRKTFQVDQSLWITGFEPRIVDQKGNALPNSLMHYAVVSNLNRNNPLCHNTGLGEPFMAATGLLSDITLPEGFGYSVSFDDPLEVVLILKNDSDVNYSDIYFELALIGRPKNSFSSIAEVRPVLLEKDACFHSTLSVQPKGLSVFESSITIPMDGTIIVGHALMQQYGAWTALYKGGMQAPFWKTISQLNDDYRIIHLYNNPYSDVSGERISAGDAINLESAYDNVSDKWFVGASAAAMIYMVSQ